MSSGYYDESGEWVEVEEVAKPALWVKSPLSMSAKHKNKKLWTAKEARKHGSTGGIICASRMSDEERTERARKAAQTRWAKCSS